ncbi:MAG TPA: 2-dehydropantoate 2-reductase [Bacteroidales bacterium]|nr:2-dehydropantoate 2-reductase [Bacteroidales bacterium]
MRICFFGVGGVGGYFGTLVTKRFKNQHEIFFIARGKHKDEIQKNGLVLKKSGGKEIINVIPDLCVDDVNNIPVCDIIILSVKSYDLDNAVKDIVRISDNKTIILPLLNGVDIYERIRKNLATGVVLPSCVYIGTHIESPGAIFQKGGNCKIHLGNDPMKPEEDIVNLKSILQESGINFSQEENVNIAIWSKFMFIATYGLVTATYNTTIGRIFIDDNLKEKTRSIMEEIYSISKKMDVPLSDDIVESSLLKAKEFSFETKTSFQRDVESKGKINEGDLFGGTIIRLGEKLNIPTPVTKEVYGKFLRMMQGTGD